MRKTEKNGRAVTGYFIGVLNMIYFLIAMVSLFLCIILLAFVRIFKLEE